jgi:hypothetical protein
VKQIMQATIVAFLTLLSATFVVGADGTIYPPDVATVLDVSGENRSQLETVIEHFADADDSLMLQAAYYLIANMEGHSYVKYGLYDTSGLEIDFDPLDYPDYATLLVAFDTLEEQYGTLDFQRNDTTYDVHTITADFLIDQIDFAFRAWREKPWAHTLSFDTFCKYVLPYRGSSEPLESWRSEFWERYADVDEKVADESDAIEATRLINDDIRSWFKFNERFYYHPTDQGLSEMLDNRMGRCEDMTNITIYALRANGLAVTSDYTPYWANSGNNHAWNAIVTADGKVIPFMGAEANPGEYRLSGKVAKVYRKMFGKQRQNLAFQEHKQEKIPRWLSGKSYVDVTKDYVNVTDVAIAFEKNIPDSVDLAYLCVFNSGEWKAIHWGRIDDGVALFTDMGVDIAYLPALFLNEEIVPFGAPFLLDTNSSIHYAGISGEQTTTLRLTSTTRRKREISTDGVEKVYLNANVSYELSYWSDGWQSLGVSVARDEPLVYEKVPSGGLYWLVAEDSDGEHERIFTFEDGRQVWW